MAKLVKEDISIGKVYEAVDASRVKILAVHKDADKVFYVGLIEKEGEWIPQKWNDKGVCVSDKKSGIDLIIPEKQYLTFDKKVSFKRGIGNEVVVVFDDKSFNANSLIKKSGKLVFTEEAWK